MAEDYADKIALAERMFVIEGRSLAEIAMSLDIAGFRLQDEAKRGDWNVQRLAEMARQKAVDPNNTLNKHEDMIRKAGLLIEESLIKLKDPDLTIAKAQILRIRIAAGRDLMESLERLIESDRKIHGVKTSAPSVNPDAGEVQGVAYVVKLPSAVQEQTESL